ncbi:hypothetical protein DNH61_09990 [Paenibacillus sambharensis]|uniref:Transposase zinc-ribbon domain-containing protein n=1 Tax=Paenibacillus sambharensis TaxID=1803190 RepID=A0A2W1LAN7_9BACL|nr:transposase [Paenibacillus sambharensis]PZD95779.1 hypothetical protein DNH61_09990 [Paenibacillus sambharensis]
MISLSVFMKEYGDETNCRSMLERIRWPDGFCCPRCDFSYYYYIGTRGLYQCLECGAQTSVTSGTMMHRTRLPLSYWLYVVHNIAAGHIITAAELSKVLGVQYRSAYRLLHTARIMMSKLNGVKSLQYITNERVSAVIMQDRQPPNTQDTSLPHDKTRSPDYPDHTLPCGNIADGSIGEANSEEKLATKVDQAEGVYSNVSSNVSSNICSKQPTSTVSGWKDAAFSAQLEPAVRRAQNSFIRQAHQFVKRSYGHKVTMRYFHLYCQEYYFRIMRRSTFKMRWSLLLAKLVGIMPAY